MAEQFRLTNQTGKRLSPLEIHAAVWADLRKPLHADLARHDNPRLRLPPTGVCRLRLCAGERGHRTVWRRAGRPARGCPTMSGPADEVKLEAAVTHVVEQVVKALALTLAPHQFKTIIKF